MADLGILVNSNKNLGHVVNLAKAAAAKGKDMRIFFTGQGVLCTQEPEFEELVGKAKLFVCDVSFRSWGMSGDVPGVGFKEFVTQAKNAEMIEECEKYVVF